MNFKEALKKLDIEEYGQRIFNSNSKGELFHLMDYIQIAEVYEKPTFFKDFFNFVVKEAEEKWNRPESVFQHIPELLTQAITNQPKQ